MLICKPLIKTLYDHTDNDSRYLIHAPFFSDKKEDHQEKWRQMEELKAQGLTKSIGVSNYLPQHLDWQVNLGKTCLRHC